MRHLVRPLLLLLAAVAVGGAYWHSQQTPATLTLTGVVTTHEIVASPQITGRVRDLRVAEGDQVTKGQLLAVLEPDELREERAFFEYSAAGLGSQVRESEAAVRWQQQQTRD